jgi:hypothetical protein
MTRIPMLIEVRFMRIPTEWAMGSGEIPGHSKPQSIAKPTVKKGSITYLDGWEMRNRFLRLPQTESAALNFLQEVGLWWTVEGLPPELGAARMGAAAVTGVYGGRYLSETALPVHLDDFWKEQATWRWTLKNQKEWKQLFTPSGATSEIEARTHAFSELPLRVEWQEGRPIAVIETITGQQLLVATTHIDLIRHARFRTCQRPDCGIPFAVTSKHTRKYCEWYCGHLESVRKKRRRDKRKRKEASHAAKDGR